MPNKQTLQLLSTAVAIKTNLEYQNKELKAFLDSAQIIASKLINSLEDIAVTLQSVSNCTPQLGKSETEMLQKCKIGINKVARELNTQLEKPYLQYQRETNNAHSKIMEKMLIQAGKLDPSSAELVRKHLNQGLDIILDINKQLDHCVQLIDKCKTKLSATEQHFKHLNFPNSIEETTKEILKLSTTLTNLSLQLEEESSVGYAQQFLDPALVFRTSMLSYLEENLYERNTYLSVGI